MKLVWFHTCVISWINWRFWDKRFFANVFIECGIAQRMRERNHEWWRKREIEIGRAKISSNVVHFQETYMKHQAYIQPFRMCSLRYGLSLSLLREVQVSNTSANSWLMSIERWDLWSSDDFYICYLKGKKWAHGPIFNNVQRWTWKK